MAYHALGKKGEDLRTFREKKHVKDQELKFHLTSWDQHWKLEESGIMSQKSSRKIVSNLEFYT